LDKPHPPLGSAGEGLTYTYTGKGDDNVMVFEAELTLAGVVADIDCMDGVPKNWPRVIRMGGVSTGGAGNRNWLECLGKSGPSDCAGAREVQGH
jgi:hypothetical protein